MAAVKRKTKTTKRTRGKNPGLYAYQVLYSTPAGFKRLGAFPARSRTAALNAARAELKKKRLWTAKTKLITGAVPLTSTAAKHANPRADITRIVRDQIRVGASYPKMIQLLKQAGFSGKMLEEAKAIYQAEKAAEIKVARREIGPASSRRMTAKQLAALRKRQQMALPGVRLRNKGALKSAGKTVAKAAKTLYKGTGKALTKLGKAMSNPARLTDQEIVVLRAMNKIDRGGLVSIKKLIQSLSYPKATTKKALLRLAEKGVIVLHQHDWPSSVSRDDRKLMLTSRDGKGKLHYYIGAAIRDGVDLPAEAYGRSNPRKRSRSRKRNDGAAERREQFAGKVTGYKDLYFPEGTPGGLSTLGPLVLIKTAAGTIQPTNGAAYLCQDANNRLYIGATKDAPLWAGPAESLGKVTRVEYTCKKPHLGERQTVIWFHDFESPLPELRADGKGGLKFHGGGYTIKREGIVG